ncbi:hypothetical protein IAT38_004967 [Cryptococcus sp. DSM 104549]
MLSFSTVPITVAIVLGASIASASDDRLLLTKPDCVSNENFGASFVQLCPVFKTEELKFYNGNLTLGDANGENTDKNSLAFCTYTNANGDHISYTEELAAQLGSSLANNSLAT